MSDLLPIKCVHSAFFSTIFYECSDWDNGEFEKLAQWLFHGTEKILIDSNNNDIDASNVIYSGYYFVQDNVFDFGKKVKYNNHDYLLDLYKINIIVEHLIKAKLICGHKSENRWFSFILQCVDVDTTSWNSNSNSTTVSSDVKYERLIFLESCVLHEQNNDEYNNYGKLFKKTIRNMYKWFTMCADEQQYIDLVKQQKNSIHVEHRIARLVWKILSHCVDI